MPAMSRADDAERPFLISGEGDGCGLSFCYSVADVISFDLDRMVGAMNPVKRKRNLLTVLHIDRAWIESVYIVFSPIGGLGFELDDGDVIFSCLRGSHRCCIREE